METMQVPINVTINPIHTKEAVLQAIEKNYAEFDHCLNKIETTASEIITTLETLDHRLGKICNLLHYLIRVSPTKEVIETYSAIAENVGAYAYHVVQHKKLQVVICNMLQKNLPHEERAILNHYQTMLSLSGTYLSSEVQQQYALLQNEINQAIQLFDQTLLQKVTLDGIGTEFILDELTYKAMIIKEDSHETRRKIYETYYARNNMQAITTLVNKRLNVARLLGYDHYLAMSLSSKSQGDITTIKVFLDELAELAITQCERITKEIKKTFHVESICSWDIDYYLRKYSELLTGVSNEEVSEYYEIDQVFAGLSTLTKELFHITLMPIATDAKWHPDVKLFSVKEDDKLLGYLYADLFARPNKYGNAWVEAYQSRRKLAEQHIQLPIVLLTCNFSAPVKDTPCLLSQSELVSLFHEFGHTLHHLLSESDYASLAGTNGVALDEVEIPSMFFERFAWNKNVIDMITDHKMPNRIFSAIRYTRQFMAPFILLHRLKMAYCDLALYSTTKALAETDIQKRIQEVETKLNVLDTVDSISWYNTAALIFTSPYAAGYYGYLWSEMLAADLFSIFSKQGVVNPAMGESLRKYLLAPAKPLNITQLINNQTERNPSLRAFLTDYSIPGGHYE